MKTYFPCFLKRCELHIHVTSLMEFTQTFRRTMSSLKATVKRRQKKKKAEEHIYLDQ